MTAELKVIKENLTFEVVEQFVSINGEGLRAGELALFIRFRGCNLTCSYCDTAWANTDACPAQTYTLEELLQSVKASGVVNVTLTGGEPLLRPGVLVLVEQLMKKDFHVEIETNGSVDLSELVAMRKLRQARRFRQRGSLSLTVDYKLPGSGQHEAMLMDNYRLLGEEDAVKFVASNLEDLEHARGIIERYELARNTQPYLSTAFGQLTPAEVVDYMKSHHMNGVRLQLQLHKYIWDPNLKGV